MTGISKRDAAQRQLDCAIRLLDSEDLAAHTLAYAAYCLLRDLSKADLRKLEDALRLREVPEFLKHARSDPQDILREHSPKAAQMTIGLAIQLWEDLGETLTDAMRDFRERPNPYRTGYRHSAAFEALEQGSIPAAENLVTQATTVSGASPINRKK